MDFHSHHDDYDIIMTTPWLELKQPVELLKNIFIDAYLTHHKPSKMMGLRVVLMFIFWSQIRFVNVKLLLGS